MNGSKYNLFLLASLSDLLLYARASALLILLSGSSGRLYTEEK